MKKMKMRLTGFLAFALLSISILSYGFSDVVICRLVITNPALPVYLLEVDSAVLLEMVHLLRLSGIL